MSQIFTRDIGTVFILDTEVDITGLTNQEIILTLPNGNVITKDAAVVDGDPIDGKIFFTSVTGDWSQAGDYSAQARITFGAQVFYGVIVTFKVAAIL